MFFVFLLMSHMMFLSICKFINRFSSSLTCVLLLEPLAFLWSTQWWMPQMVLSWQIFLIIEVCRSRKQLISI